MEKWITTTPEALLAIVVSTFGIYMSVIIFTRIFGKRSLSKMSSFDFAMTVAVGSLIATTALSKTVSLIDGVIGMFMIYLCQLGVAYFRRWNSFRNTVDNSPLLLMLGPKILEDNLLKARLTKGDLRSSLRKANVLDLADVRAVVFETTGDVVVLHSANTQKKLADWLIDDVIPLS